MVSEVGIEPTSSFEVQNAFSTWCQKWCLSSVTPECHFRDANRGSTPMSVDSEAWSFHHQLSNPSNSTIVMTRIKQEPDTNGYCCSTGSSNTSSNGMLNNGGPTATPNGGGFALAQIQNLALKECTKEIDVACEVLGISADPFNWSVADVQSWLLWTQRQFNLQPFPLEYFSMDGMTLCTLNEADFKQRAPHCGDILYAQLDIWKTAVDFRPEENCFTSWSLSTPPSSPQTVAASLSSAPGSINGDSSSQRACLSPVSPAMCPSPVNSTCTTPIAMPAVSSPGSKLGLSSSVESGIVTSDYGSEGAQSDDEISDDGCELSSSSTILPTANANSGSLSSPTGAGGRTGSGSHIHLWQFLKELLSQPQMYGSCIRWLDRPKGIFKIEDSVRVARLWGKRKNRPAMNYDKLSRSIRQYYKKGIMKKTERSQRLVYQFCHPYCL